MGELEESNIQAIVEAENGRLWLGTNNLGLLNLNRASGELVRFSADPENPASLKSNNILSLIVDFQNFLWVGTDQGLHLYNPTTAEFFVQPADPINPTSIKDNQIRALLEDHAKGIWIGTAYGGLSRYDRRSQQFTNFPQDSFSSPFEQLSIWGIYQEANKSLWLGTNGEGLVHFNPLNDTWEQYRYDPNDPLSLSEDVVVALYPDSVGDLWVGTWGGGLNHLDIDKGHFVQYRSDPDNPNTISSDVIWFIEPAAQGNLWIGTPDGLNYLHQDRRDFTRIQHDPTDPNSLSSNLMGAVLESPDGTLWVGTHGGLNRRNPRTEKFIRYVHEPGDPSSLSHDVIFALHQDQEGILWIGTFGGGLNRFDPETETFKTYRQSDGLPNDTIYAILADEQDRLWISTNNGISCFDPVTEIFKNYGAADGLQASEFNYNARFLSPSGTMYFGGVQGFNQFKPDQITDNPVIPPVWLTSITQNGVPLSLSQTFPYTKELTLRWPNNFLDFEFTTLNYFQSEKNQYAYFLENFDVGWNLIQDRRFGRYTNLPGGTYTLQLSGSNNDGLWNDTGTNLEITVIPPVWETWTFRATAILVLGAVIAGGYSLRVRSIEARQKELESQVQARTHELAALNTISRTVNQSLDLDSILESSLENILEVLDLKTAAVFILDPESGEISFGCCSESSEDVKRVFQESEVLEQVTTTGDPLLITDLGLFPTEYSLLLTAGYRSLTAIPLKSKNQVLGILVAASRKVERFSSEDVDLLLAIGSQIGVAIENANLYRSSQQLAVLEERQRLARELHDSVTQALYGMTLYAEAISRHLNAGKVPQAEEQLDELRATAQEALAEMRLLIFQLRPPDLEREGLIGALFTRLESVETRSGIETNFVAPDELMLTAEIEQALYRIAQETLNNCIKHAQASQLAVTLQSIENHVILKIQDNGVGFEYQPALDGPGLGLDNILERVEELGGDLEVITSPGKGTIIKVDIPL